MAPVVNYDGEGRLRIPGEGQTKDVVLNSGENDVTDAQAKVVTAALKAKTVDGDVVSVGKGEPKADEPKGN